MKTIVLRESTKGKQLSKSEKQLGVKERTTEADYKEYLKEYNLVDENIKRYGNKGYSFSSKVMIFKKK